MDATLSERGSEDLAALAHMNLGVAVGHFARLAGVGFLLMVATLGAAAAIDVPKMKPALLAPIYSGEAVNVTVTTLPVDKTVTIAYRVTVNNPLPLGTFTISNQGTVTLDSENILTDDPTVDGSANPTVVQVDRPDTTVLSIQRSVPPAAQTNVSSVEWMVTLNNPITLLTSSNFSLVNTGLGGTPSITSVTPSGGLPATTWIVTAGTGSGNGTLGLNLVNDTGLSHDLTNIPFTGVTYTLERTAPAVANVTSGKPNGSYTAGTLIQITVSFSEPVFVTGTGTPWLQLETGGVDQTAEYIGGSGSADLIFLYTVQPGDSTTDLDYLTSTALDPDSTSIQDVAGNTADLTLPNPAATGSLGANKNIIIDTVVPTVTIEKAIASAT